MSTGAQHTLVNDTARRSSAHPAPHPHIHQPRPIRKRPPTVVPAPSAVVPANAGTQRVPGSPPRQPPSTVAVAPAQRPPPLQPCHPPLALAPRRLYTSPMRNPTSAYPGLPDTARGISPRSRNCPESGPPYPQNGSCRTGRIVSAADGFEADSFPKIKNLEFNQIAGVPLVLRVRPREGRAYAAPPTAARSPKRDFTWRGGRPACGAPPGTSGG